MHPIASAPVSARLPRRRRQALRALGAGLLGWACGPASAQPGAAALQAVAEATPHGSGWPLIEDETWFDAARRRAVPVRLRWPSAGLAAPPGGFPVVLYSHGLGGTRGGAEIWGRAWASAGLVVVHLQHAGSDLDAVRQIARDFSDQANLRRAAGPQQLLERLGDVGFALDELARRQAAGGSRWSRVRASEVGMAGHSFGAHTTMAMAGQRYPAHPGIDEPRLAAFIAFSPTLPARGDAVWAFGRITRPMLTITGTRDDDVVGVGATPERRIGVFAAVPSGRKAHLVLHDADHMTFAGQTGRAAEIVPRSAEARQLQPHHHALVARISTDWWRAQLLGDAAARAWLDRPEGLAPGDRWQQG